MVVIDGRGSETRSIQSGLPQGSPVSPVPFILSVSAMFQNGTTARYHVYITPRTNPAKDPLFVCHHGVGSSGISCAVFAKELRDPIPNAGVLSLDARGHGSSILTATSQEASPDYSLETLTSDALNILQSTQTQFSWSQLPPLAFIGHSLGGAVMTNLTTVHGKLLAPTLIGYAMLDVAEGAARSPRTHESLPRPAALSLRHPLFSYRLAHSYSHANAPSLSMVGLSSKKDLPCTRPIAEPPSSKRITLSGV